jgi:hypothetical protein
MSGLGVQQRLGVELDTLAMPRFASVKASGARGFSPLALFE